MLLVSVLSMRLFLRVAEGDRWRPGIGRDARRHDGRRRPVPEKHGRDDVGLLQPVGAEGERAGLDRDDEDGRLRVGGGQTARDGEARHAAGAAEPEDRHPAQIGAEPHRREGPRLERGGRDPGGRDGHDGVHLPSGQARAVERGQCRIDEEGQGAIEVRGVARGPALRALEPVHRHDEMPGIDPGIVEGRDQPVELGVGRAQKGGGALPHLVLTDPVRRQRMADAVEENRGDAVGAHDVCRQHGWRILEIVQQGPDSTLSSANPGRGFRFRRLHGAVCRAGPRVCAARGSLAPRAAGPCCL